MKTAARGIKENVNISDKVKANIVRTIKEAEKGIKDDEDSISLMKRIRKQGEPNVNVIRRSHQDELKKLIQYGMVNVLLNNEVVISGIGLQVLKSLENRNRSLVSSS